MMLLIYSEGLFARGSYCHTDECKESSVWIIYFLGYLAIFFAVWGKRSVKGSPSTEHVVKTFVAAIVIMIGVFFLVGAVLNITGGYLMLISGLSGYIVFWFLIKPEDEAPNK
jgi:hypothetical protein